MPRRIVYLLYDATEPLSDLLTRFIPPTGSWITPEWSLPASNH